MHIEPRQVLLNAIASWRPAFDLVRRLRDRGRAPDHAALVENVLSRFRVRVAAFGADRLRGADVLEIGSGRELGLALLLVHAGARRVANVEIEPYGFIRDRAFYALLVERARQERLALGWPPAGLVEDSRSGTVAPDPARISLHLGCSAAAIPEPDGAFDLVFSVSVLQHVRREDLPRVARELFRVMRPGAVGHHRIDLHDLESGEPYRHLCYSDLEYRLMFQYRSSYCNRYRMDDYERIFREAGFPDVRFDDVRLPDDDRDFQRALPHFDAEFRDRPHDVLRPRGCVLLLRR